MHPTNRSHFLQKALEILGAPSYRDAPNLTQNLQTTSPLTIFYARPNGLLRLANGTVPR